MSQPSEEAIREQAYYLWEQDGRPFGRDAEYWQRAVILATPKTKLDALSAAAPAKAKPKAKAKAEAKVPEAKPKVKVKAAATQSKPAPAKSVKTAAKPKKK